MDRAARAEDGRIIGNRIKALRVREGLSRADIARRIGVDVTAVAGWEAGKYWPRQRHRASLARLLGTGLEALFSNQKDTTTLPVLAVLVDTLTDLPVVLDELLARTQRCMRVMHTATPMRRRLMLSKNFAVIFRLDCSIARWKYNAWKFSTI